MTSKQVLALAKLFQLKPHTASMWDQHHQAGPVGFTWADRAQHIQTMRSGWTVEDIVAMYEINEVLS